MSHRIIIGSTAALPPPSEGSAQSAVESPGTVETSVEYAPPHPESPQQTLAKVSKIMKLVQRIEQVAAGTGGEAEHE